MNILQVVSSSRTSGAERHVLILAERLHQRGHNVVVVCPPNDWLPLRLHEVGVPTIEMPMRGLLSWTAVFKLCRVARKHAIDVIHAHLTRATYLGYFAASLVGVPVISTVHVQPHDVSYRYLPRCNHWLIAVSNHIRELLIARGLPPHQVYTVHNGSDFVEAALSHPKSALSVRAELGLPSDAELIGLIGRVRLFKGHHILVSAAPAIVQRCPRAYFVFVGPSDPALQQKLWEMASAHGIEERLRFVGVREDVPRLMQAMDVITLPSVTEACSMAIIEAMAMGKPVVATRAGGNPELIEEQRTGLLVERTPEAFAEAIISLLQNPSRRDAMGQAGQARVRSLFSAEGMIQNIENIYWHILNSQQRAGV